MFDLQILDAAHLQHILAGFALTAGALLGLQRIGPISLRIAKQRPSVYYGGLILAAVTVGLAGLVLPPSLWIGLIVAAILISVGGWLDERFSLTPGQQLIWQLTAAIAAVSFGWTIPYVTHPSGAGVLSLNWLQQGMWIFPGSLLAIVWLFTLMNAINWLDGVDGLAGSISLVTLVTLLAISLLPATQDATTLGVAVIGIGVVAGFLFWNWAPARVYLGTSGSWFLGLYLGLAAIVGGGKIATTLLVLTLPLIDAVFVIIERVRHHQLPWRGGDRRHLHDRLSQLGLSARQITLRAAGFTILLSVVAFTAPTRFKLVIISVAALLFIILLGTLTRHAKSH